MIYDIFTFLASTNPVVGFQEETRHAIPAWDVLLQVYGGFLLPVLLALLIGVNMLVWKHYRINYVFIFGKLPTGSIPFIF